MMMMLNVTNIWLAAKFWTVTTRARSSSQWQESCFWSSQRNLWAHLLWSKFCKPILIYFSDPCNAFKDKSHSLFVCLQARSRTTLSLVTAPRWCRPTSPMVTTSVSTPAFPRPPAVTSDLKWYPASQHQSGSCSWHTRTLITLLSSSLILSSHREVNNV